jgi:ferredoxin
MQVWIDQYLCIGCGLCTVLSPNSFTVLDDQLSYVRDRDGVKNDPGRSAGIASILPEDEDAVLEASSYCPVSCIFVDS